MIEFEDVRIAYKDKPVLDGVSLTIHDREFFVLIGSSGCGKTTLLKSISRSRIFPKRLDMWYSRAACSPT